jgi:hypothetical protein
MKKITLTLFQKSLGCYYLAVATTNTVNMTNNLNHV